jgi:hypothetical protein
MSGQTLSLTCRRRGIFLTASPCAHPIHRFIVKWVGDHAPQVLLFRVPRLADNYPFLAHNLFRVIFFENPGIEFRSVRNLQSPENKLK